MIEVINKIMFSMISGFIGAFIFFSLQSQFNKQEIAVIEMDRILKSHVEHYGRDVIDQVLLDKQAEKFNVALTDTIKEVSSEFNVVLVVDPAIVTDVPDLTELVMTRVQERMRVDAG